MKNEVCKAYSVSKSFNYHNGEIIEDVCCRFAEGSITGDNVNRERCNTCIGLKESFNEYDENKGVQSLTIKVGNYCNMKCEICSSAYSSRYGVDDNSNEYLEYVYSYVENNIDTILDISLYGGETFLDVYSNFILKIMNLVSDKNISITLVTNGTILNDAIMEKISSMDNNVILIFSIDGYESHYKYRIKDDNYSMELIISNMRKYRKALKKNDKLIINSVISTLNIETISIEMKKFISIFKDIDFVNYKTLIYPSSLCVPVDEYSFTKIMELIIMMSSMNIDFNKDELLKMYVKGGM